MTAVPTRGVFQTDGWGWNKTAFGYAAYTKPWGKGAHAGETRVLALYYDDWRNGVVKTDNRSLVARRADQTADIRIGTFGGHSIHAFDTKKVTYDLMVWGVGQTGKWGVLNHRAHAISLEGGFQPKAFKKLKPWFRGGFYDGSGAWAWNAGKDRQTGADGQTEIRPIPRKEVECCAASGVRNGHPGGHSVSVAASTLSSPVLLRAPTRGVIGFIQARVRRSHVAS